MRQGDFVLYWDRDVPELRVVDVVAGANVYILWPSNPNTQSLCPLTLHHDNYDGNWPAISTELIQRAAPDFDAVCTFHSSSIYSFLDHFHRILKIA